MVLTNEEKKTIEKKVTVWLDYFVESLPRLVVVEIGTGYVQDTAKNVGKLFPEIKVAHDGNVPLTIIPGNEPELKLLNLPDNERLSRSYLWNWYLVTNNLILFNLYYPDINKFHTIEFDAKDPLQLEFLNLIGNTNRLVINADGNEPAIYDRVGGSYLTRLLKETGFYIYTDEISTPRNATSFGKKKLSRAQRKQQHTKQY